MEQVRKALLAIGLDQKNTEEVVQIIDERLLQQAIRKKRSETVMSPESIGNTDIARRDTARYVFTSESEYYSKLESLNSTYLGPIREKKLFGKDTPAAIQKVFSNLEVLFSLHRDLKNKLSTEYLRKDGPPCLGAIFCAAVPSMKIYTQYVINFSTAIETLSDLQAKNKSLSAFLSKASENDEFAPVRPFFSFFFLSIFLSSFINHLFLSFFLFN